MNRCTCEAGHNDQIERFPLHSKVVALHDIPTGSFPPVKQGTFGVVCHHCNDGRAGIKFDNGQTHTFHFPENYIVLA